MIRYLIVVCIALASTGALAQPAPPPDPLADKLFPPEAIMSHQRELALDATSRDRLVAEIQRFQATAVKLQWDLDAAGADLAKQLASPHVDETAALAAADKVMQLEHDLKRAHLQLLIRLKNALTPAQQTRLREALAHK
jgi:Spy/CpxP family protein refolding chaperone